jgi:polyhydroxybutyrate depolymerase
MNKRRMPLGFNFSGNARRASHCPYRLSANGDPRPMTLMLFMLLSILPCFAQDQQAKGVTTYGGAPSARKLYAQPVEQPRTRGRRGERGGGTYGVTSAVGVSNRDFSQTISSRGAARKFLVHVPVNYNRSRSTPVILVFHGMNMNGAMMPAFTGMNAAADRYGYIVVYPFGYNNVWNDGLQQRAADDVGFVQDMLGALAHELNVDQNHIYACGLSNGGYFSQRLACDLPGRIQAIAVVAAAGLQSICNSCSASAVPTMFFLGTKDPLVPRDGTDGESLGKLGDLVGLGDLGIDKLSAVKDFAGMLSQQDAIEWWAKHNGAGSQPMIQNMPDASPNDKCRVKREVYGGGRREVVAYIVEGGGHTWPGGMPVASGTLGRTTGDINASELICEFFRTH